MKRLFPIFLVALPFSCSKNENGEHCYTCHLTGGVPYEHKTIDTCSGDVTSDKDHFEEANGNVLDFLCLEK